MAAQPRDQLVEAELVCLVEGDDKCVGLLSVRRETGAVDSEKGIGGGESRPLVAVDEGRVWRQAFPERGGFLDQTGIIAGLWPVERGLPAILDP